MLRSCTALLLKEVLDVSVPYVWIRRHQPVRSLQWWKTETVLKRNGPLHDIDIRSMEFDIQMPTERFLDLLPEFANHGLVLFQMSQRVPDTLTLDRIPDEHINRVLIQNGLHLKVYLPHEYECAQLAAPHGATLERILLNPLIRELAY